MSNQSKVEKLASKHLGQKGGEGYSETYDPTLLVPIPRRLNRVDYGIKQSELPFEGYDTWNAYEVSALTEKGLPVNGMLKITYPADSQNHVESKSLKLYLNSFNMTIMGKNQEEVVAEIEKRVTDDLTEILKLKQGSVQITMFREEDKHKVSTIQGFDPLSTLVDIDGVKFDVYKSDASQLKVAGSIPRNAGHFTLKVESDLLRSNCRVTNQPDWGNLYIWMESPKLVEPVSLAKYIVSHRQVNHFHEEVVEMVFTHLKEAYTPERLMVAALYTRRGGIDINPVRATHHEMIPEVFFDSQRRLEKTLRQ